MFDVPTPPDTPRAVTDADFPAEGPLGEQLGFLLHYAVLAPSVLNTQPWRFVVDAPVVRLYADRARQLGALDPDGRELTISCGAALYHLRVAARHFGFAPDVYPLPIQAKPELLAALSFQRTRPPDEDDDRLFRAIARRHTDRHPFAAMPVSADVLALLERAAREEGAHLAVLEDADAKAAVADLVAAGIQRQGESRRVMEDVRRWLRDDADPRRDGVRDRYQGEWDRRSAVRIPSSTLAHRTRGLVAASPAVLALTTEADTPRAWLAAGQALARVLLTAADLDLQASYLNQPVEVGALRPRVAALVGGVPQLVFRLGQPVQREGTPRRPVQDVLGLGAAT